MLKKFQKMKTVHLTCSIFISIYGNEYLVSKKFLPVHLYAEWSCNIQEKNEISFSVQTLGLFLERRELSLYRMQESCCKDWCKAKA